MTLLAVGDRIEVEIESIAHGGHAIARYGPGRQVIFVRHALPGERVIAQITRVERALARADAVEIVVPAAQRVEPPCRYASRCGGCDFQHVEIGYQRELKAQVVRECIRRIGKLEPPEGFYVEDVSAGVEPLRSGLGWRTRQRYHVAGGQPGMYAHRGHDLVVIDECLIAAPGLPAVLGQPWPKARELYCAVTSGGKPVLNLTRAQAAGKQIRETVTVEVNARDTTEQFRLSAASFWQVHPKAPAVLVQAVLDAVAPVPGEHALDLYCGVGLFARFLARAGCTVTAVEGDVAAAGFARQNLAEFGAGNQVVCGDVATVLANPSLAPNGIVVLDPPRAGAGATVVAQIADRAPRVVAYVACDPAALARDLGLFAARGYRLSSLRGFDLFPMTQHVECLALLEPTA